MRWLLPLLQLLLLLHVPLLHLLRLLRVLLLELLISRFVGILPSVLLMLSILLLLKLLPLLILLPGHIFLLLLILLISLCIPRIRRSRTLICGQIFRMHRLIPVSCLSSGGLPARRRFMPLEFSRTRSRSYRWPPMIHGIP